MALTITDYSDLIKEQLQPAITDLLVKKTILTQHVKDHTKQSPFRGETVELPLHSSRNEGLGARAEDVNLPTALTQGHTRSKWDAKFLYGQINLSGPAMAASESSTAAVAAALTTEMRGMIRDVAQDYNRQLWGNGTSVLTGCGVTGAVTTVEVVDTKYIKKDMWIEIRNRDDGDLIGTAQQVLTVPNATQFTVGSAVTTAATDAIYREGARGAPGGVGSWNIAREVWGLEALVTDTNIGSTEGFSATTDEPGKIDKSTVTEFQANMVDASAANLSFLLMHQAYGAADEFADEKPNIGLTTYQGLRVFGDLFDGNRRYANTMKLEGGYTGLEFNGIGIFADRDAHISLSPGTCSRIYFLDLRTFGHYVQKDWDWIPGTQGVLHKVANKDTYEGTLRSYRQFAVKNPKANSVLHNIGDIT